MKSSNYLKIAVLVIILLLVAFTMFGANAQTAVPDTVLAAIHQVETGGRSGAIKGDNGNALGPFQIHRDYWQDSRVRGSYDQCADYAYSVKVVTAYLNRYAWRHLKSKNFEALARIHNGGPLGYSKPSTVSYWRKVQREISRAHINTRTPFRVGIP